MEISRVCNLDFENPIKAQLYTPKELSLPKVIWAKIFEYMSVKDECKFRQCAYWTNFLSITSSSPLSDEKILMICHYASYQMNIRNISQYNSPYLQSWYKRVRDVSSYGMPSRSLNKNIFATFPNLQSVRISNEDVCCFFLENCRLFDNEKRNAEQKNIVVKIEKSAFYSLGKERLNRLFEIFPSCTRVEFTRIAFPSRLDAHKINIDLCNSWGLIPKVIYKIYSEIGFDIKKKHYH